MTNKFLVRPIAPLDREPWERLWQGYQTFYKIDLSAEVTTQTWSRFFDGLEPVNALVAERAGEIVGFVHFIFHRSTWLIGPTCYLQDLFTSEAARGAGIGRALIAAVYERAQSGGAQRVYWLTHQTNETAITLYDKVADRSGFIQYRKIF
jgi:GNAT superfamily N-acetyltransferase